MEKKILVALDDSSHSKNAVKYASEVSRHINEFKLTLINVQPGISEYLVDEARKSSSSKKQLNKIVEKNKKTSMALLADCRNQLKSFGVHEEHIQTETIPKKFSVAKDILNYAESGRFDAILVGRSGVSYLKKFILGSVTSNLLRLSHVIPIWIVDNEVKSHKIIIPIDGSEGSLRAVDHLTFILGDNTKKKITFLHIRPKLGDFCEIDASDETKSLEEILDKGNQKCVDHFYNRTLNMLKSSGFNENNIELIQRDNYFFMGKSILEEIQKSESGTILIGKSSGVSKEELGSVSRYIINQAENCAIWVVP